MARAPKKSESLEIRLPYETKTAFMDRCRRDGVTASEVLRGDIEARLTGSPRSTTGWRRWRRIAAGAAVVLAVGGAALPSLAGSLDRAGFAGLDTNRDDVLAFSEFSAAPLRLEAGGVKIAVDPAQRRALLRQTFDACDTDHNGALTFAEFRTKAI